MDNRTEQAQIVSAATYINCPPETIIGRLQGKYDMGDGRKFRDPNPMIFSQRGCNYPQPKFGKWWLSQLRRWGFTDPGVDYAGITKRVMRPDLFEDAMKDLGVSHGGLDQKPETFFDGKVFDPAADIEAYAMSFDVKTPKA